MKTAREELGMESTENVKISLPPEAPEGCYWQLNPDGSWTLMCEGIDDMTADLADDLL